MHYAEMVETTDAVATEPLLSPPTAEEAANQITHAVGFVASLAGAWLLYNHLQDCSDARQLVGCSIYGSTLVAVFAASTLSHSFRHPLWRDFFRMLDQICIFLVIVGSFTPFALVHLRGGFWWALLAAMWLFAVVGIVLRVKSNNRSLSTLCYLPLGWLPVLTIGRMASVGGSQGLALILAGGLAYTFGVWFLVNDERRPYFHTVWHVLVIVGSTFHYVFMLRYVAMWHSA